MASYVILRSSLESNSQATPAETNNCSNKIVLAIVIIVALASLFLIAFGGAGLAKALICIDISNYYYEAMILGGVVGFAASVAIAVYFKQKLGQSVKEPESNKDSKAPEKTQTLEKTQTTEGTQILEKTQTPEKKQEVETGSSESVAEEKKTEAETSKAENPLLRCIKISVNKMVMTDNSEFTLVNFGLRLELDASQLNVSQDDVVDAINSTVEKLKKGFGPCCVSVSIDFNSKEVEDEQHVTLFELLCFVADNCRLNILKVIGTLQGKHEGCFGKTDFRAETQKVWEELGEGRVISYAQKYNLTENDSKITLQKFMRASASARKQVTVNHESIGSFLNVKSYENKQEFSLEELGL
jgi:hypothetical protein